MSIFWKSGNVEERNAKTAAASLQELAGAQVLRNLSTPIKLPWECNAVLNPKRAFTELQPSLKQSIVGMREFATNVGGIIPDEPVLQTTSLSRSLKRARLASCVSSPDDMRFRALSLVKIMVDADRSQTRLAAQVGVGVNGPLPVWQSLRDAFSNKATATLYKRTNSLWGLFAWVRQKPGCSGLDLTEGALYEYLTHLKECKRGATSGEAVLQSVRFFHSILGFRSFEPSTDISARVIGVARQMYVTKPMLKQATALFVPELKALEDVVVDETQPHLVVIAGYLLFCVMGVCRFSDLLYSKGLSVSRFNNTVLVEAGTSVHKTAHTKERKTMLLPIMALGHVFRKDKSWGERWVKVVEKQFAGVNKQYLLPAYSEQLNRWLARPMTTAEGTLWLRDLVQMRCKTGDALTSHSMKTTLLAWATVFEVLNFQQRRVLGHHIDVGMASPLTYGRDNLTPLQVSIHAMIQKISLNIWDPDAPRAQRLDRQIELEKTLTDLDKDLDGAVFGPFSTPAVDLEELETAVETDDRVDKAQDPERVFIAAEKADGRLMQHNSSGVLHFVGVENKFVCGRQVNALYGMVDVDLSHQWPVCQQCRRAVGEDVLSTFIEE